MTLVRGSVSLSSLIDAARPTVNGRMVRGKTTKLRNGRMESRSGTCGAAISAMFPIPVKFVGAGFSSLPGCKALIGSSFMILKAAKPRGGRYAVLRALFRYPLTLANAPRARMAHNRSPWPATVRGAPRHALARGHRAHREQ